MVEWVTLYTSRLLNESIGGIVIYCLKVKGNKKKEENKIKESHKGLFSSCEHYDVNKQKSTYC